MVDERHRRARELLESSGMVLFFKEKQLLKEYRFAEVGEILNRRLRRTRIFMLITLVLVTAISLVARYQDPDPTWMDYASILSVLTLIALTEYGHHKVRRTLSQVDAILGETGSGAPQTLS